MRTPDDSELEALLEGSSLDTPGARRLRQRTSATQAGVVRRLRHLAPHTGAVPEAPDLRPGVPGAPDASRDAAAVQVAQSAATTTVATTAVVIRSAEQSDLEGLHRVDRLVFGRLAYPLFALAQLFELHARHCLVADDGGRLVGYCLGAVAGRPQIGWLLGLAVLPDSRDAGHGRQMVREAVRRMAAEGVGEVRLAVDPDNSAAIHLYETLGFRICGFRPEYFGPEGDRLIMSIDSGGAGRPAVAGGPA